MNYLKVSFPLAKRATFDNLFQEVLREHAQRKVVESEKLDNADFLIHELEEQVVSSKFNSNY